MSLTLPVWDMSREEHSAAAGRSRRSAAAAWTQRSAAVLTKTFLTSVPDQAQLVLALAGNQQRSLRQLHGIWAANVGHGTHQVDLSAFALTHVGLMLGYRGHIVCAAALPSTLESLACCALPLHEMPEEGGMKALLHNIWSLPCLARIHLRRNHISLPPDTELWGGKHVVMTAERSVWLHFDAGSEGGTGVFGDAVSVRIEAGTINFWFEHREHVRALAYMLCPDSLGEAVLETGSQRNLQSIRPSSFIPGMDWRQILHALIVERGDLFAFEVETRLNRIRLAWRRWPPRGTRAHVAAAELHLQAAEWAGVQPDNTQALLEQSFQVALDWNTFRGMG